MIVIPDQALISLPFATLLMDAEGDEYRRLSSVYATDRSLSADELRLYPRLSWLGRRYAISVVPSATALGTLRRRARSPVTQGEPFIGIGDPMLPGSTRTRGGAMLVARGSAVVEQVRQLHGLPGTREELTTLARTLGADPASSLYLADRATRASILNLNRTGLLSRARVISFATHGLIGGEIEGVRQPALVLTPPAVATEDDDGLLRLDDILTLNLDGVKLVVLSACNTAAGEGVGEGLSGLVRAFFFAGAPSLLVSHWSVEDRATQVLMTQIFRRYAAGAVPPRVAAEAVQSGMTAVMESADGTSAYLAHPFSWASFFLVGEGGEDSQ